MCILRHGEPDYPELEAAHSCGCGHEGCVNPNHLRWATRVQNAADKEAHGTVIRGEDVNSAKLTAADVRAIRSLHYVRTSAELAEMYGVSQGHISRIQCGVNWAHL